MKKGEIFKEIEATSESSEEINSIYKIFEICMSAIGTKKLPSLASNGDQLLIWAEREFAFRVSRAKIFPVTDILGEPCWDILLDLTVARLKGANISVSSCCIASGIAPTTALRWIAHLQNNGLIERNHDPVDKRRVFVSLSDFGLELMRRYYLEVVAPGLPTA